jgi:hypothetical protein
MVQLIIERSSEWMNKAQGIMVFINNHKIGTIYNGEAKSVEVEPGTYVVKAAMDGYESKEYCLTIVPGETRLLKLSSFVEKWRFMSLMPAMIVCNIFLLNSFHSYLWGFAMLPFVAVLLYYFTLGKKRYFILK